jgi:gluconate 2-dehydrogenase gamma chain
MHNAFMLDRRQWMQRALLLLGATAISLETACKSGADAGQGSLDKAQLALLVAIVDTVVPKTNTFGAVEAGVPKKLDGMLFNWASDERRGSILKAMSEIDSAAGDKGFAALAPEARKTLLLKYDKDALVKAPDGSKDKVVKPGWMNLKELILTLYFGSELVMTKLHGYEHIPGKWVASVKA